MLSRVLEPEVMDTVADALAYDAMDHADVNRAFVRDLLAACPAATAGGPPLDVLDIGTGTAQVPIELCRRSAAFRVLAIDLAAAMLNLARGNVEVAGLTDRIRTDLVDAKQLPYRDGQFSVVMSNSIVHHIPQPPAVLNEAWRVVAPNGLLFIRDLLRPDDDATVTRLVETYAAGASDRQRQLFDDSLRAALSLDEIRRIAADLGFAEDCVQPTSDRHWTLVVRRNG